MRTAGSPALLDLVPPEGWHPVRKDGLGPPVRPRGCLYLLARLGTWAWGRSEVPNLFLLLLHTPRIVLPWTVYASRLMPRGRLDPLDRERVILRVAWNCRCHYEWMQHLEIGLSLGLSSADVRAAIGDPASEPRPVLRALLRAADELHTDHRVAEATERELRSALTDEQWLEVLFLVGHYEGLAGLLNSTTVEVEPETLSVLRGHE
jgi:4-carboxymuconolactone decarboxylase